MEALIQYSIIVLSTSVKYFIIAGVPFLLLYKIFYKRKIKAKIQTRIAKNKDFYREIGNSMLTNVIFAFSTYALAHTSLVRFTLFYKNINEYPIWWLPLSVFLALVIHDTYFYWMHRALHHPKLYKAFHLEHHKSTNPSPFASYSFHFLEIITENLVLPIVLFTLPMHPTAIFSFMLISFGINVYGHCGFEIMPKGFRNTLLFEVLNTSVHHNMHHSKFVYNFGLYFRVWDRIMKTEHPKYVEEYDRIQANRFETDTKTIKSNTEVSVSTAA